MKSIHEWFAHNTGARVRVRLRAPGPSPEEACLTEAGRIVEVGADFVSLDPGPGRPSVHVALESLVSWTVEQGSP